MGSLESFITAMPKVELHVHLEGSVRPATLLKLARKNRVELPADTIEGIARWYTFTDFSHFVEIYIKISECIQTIEDLELIAREFLAGQAEQNIVYTEATYTAYTHFHQKGIPFSAQIEAIGRAREWARSELHIDMNLIVDIAREVSPEQGIWTAENVVEHFGNGIVALGLGGYEVGHPPEKHQAAFELAARAGVPSIPHAGETAGPESIWGALNSLHAARIGHGVRCIEDPQLMDELKRRNTVLEVCPTSNVCLGVVPSLSEHMLPQLMDAGLTVTVNSDDPPMFNTTLTHEFKHCTQQFHWGEDELKKLTYTAVESVMLSGSEKSALRDRVEREFAQLAEAQGG